MVKRRLAIQHDAPLLGMICYWLYVSLFYYSRFYLLYYNVNIAIINLIHWHPFTTVHCLIFLFLGRKLNRVSWKKPTSYQLNRYNTVVLLILNSDIHVFISHVPIACDMASPKDAMTPLAAWSVSDKTCSLFFSESGFTWSRRFICL